MSFDTLGAITVSTAVAIFASWVWFSAYHFMQLQTAKWISNHIKRSFLWMVTFLIGLPLLFSPLILALFIFEQNGALIVHQPFFSLGLLTFSSASIFLGWLLSYYPQRTQLKQIGAWGWPEKENEAD